MVLKDFHEQPFEILMNLRPMIFSDGYAFAILRNDERTGELLYNIDEMLEFYKNSKAESDFILLNLQALEIFLTEGQKLSMDHLLYNMRWIRP